MAAPSSVLITNIRETFFFSSENGRLKQWIDVELSTRRWRTALDLRITSRGRTETVSAVVFGGERKTIRCYAPLVWPKPADTKAVLTVIAEGQQVEKQITVGSHRPWTVYLMSDLCADDTWAYSDLKKHDQDDYLTTLAELRLGEGNSYNFAATYQAERFLSRATEEEQELFSEAVRKRRLFVTPIPDQLLCGIFNLSSYPTVLEPYRDMLSRVEELDTPAHYAYHMESPTWTNGMANLLACCGFQVMGKSLLRYQAPWIAELDRLPRVVRLKTAPKSHIYLVLGRHGYDEGSFILSGVHETTRHLHEDVIPRHQQLGAAYPTSALGLIGMYSDLRPDSPRWGAIKCKAVEEYNSQGWDYPKLVNGTWTQFGDHLVADLGTPDKPRSSAVMTVQGDIGSSWEIWTLAAQREAARFRYAQRTVNSITSLHALCPVVGQDEAVREINLELAYLGDHAWNGSHYESKRLNLNIRKRRLKLIEDRIHAFRARIRSKAPASFGAVNTLGWDRLCEIPVRVPRGKVLQDRSTGEVFPRSSPVPIAGYGCRHLQIVPGTNKDAAGAPPNPFADLYPALDISGTAVEKTGGWTGYSGSWSLGPFTVSAVYSSGNGLSDAVIAVHVDGAPPQDPYDLRWVFIMPWKRCRWRGESGGGFHTPGPVAAGGDSLLGIRGSIFSAGEGIAVTGGKAERRIELALGQSGMCGLGGKTTAAALGTYNEKMSKDQVKATVMRSVFTKGVLEWYLLSTGQNPDEALIDQGGATSWRFRCGIRSSAGAFNDAALYRFAAGFNQPAEVVDEDLLPVIARRRMGVSGSRSIIPLGLRKRDGAIELNLYNASGTTRRINMAGSFVDGKRIALADILGRQTKASRSLLISGKTFAKVVVDEQI